MSRRRVNNEKRDSELQIIQRRMKSTLGLLSISTFLIIFYSTVMLSNWILISLSQWLYSSIIRDYSLINLGINVIYLVLFLFIILVSIIHQTILYTHLVKKDLLNMPWRQFIYLLYLRLLNCVLSQILIVLTYSVLITSNYFIFYIIQYMLNEGTQKYIIFNTILEYTMIISMLLTVISAISQTAMMIYSQIILDLRKEADQLEERFYNRQSRNIILFISFSIFAMIIITTITILFSITNIYIPFDFRLLVVITGLIVVPTTIFIYSYRLDKKRERRKDMALEKIHIQDEILFQRLDKEVNRILYGKV